MTEVAFRLSDLPRMHPGLLWNEITLAAVAALETASARKPFSISIDLQNLPDFGTDQVRLLIGPDDVPSGLLTRLRRTYESSRLVELAAIAIAGLSLYHGGGHEIRSLAFRGTAADYLVDDGCYPLEIGGRSRRSDFKAAWQQKWQRLESRHGSGFYVCVVEFETLTGRLAFAVQE